jgi:hypothetical protein
MTGYPTAANEEVIPATRFLQKPFSPKTLAEAVRDTLQN